MLKNDINTRILFSLVLIIGLLYIPSPVFSQQSPELQDLIVNGNFDEGFQDFGVGYGWGAFSNGQAVVGWSTDTWDKVVPTGQTSAQMIEIKDAQEINRYAGIYQTITVVPGAQYKLTLKGLIRSTEGDIAVSDYGYRLQVGVDQNGGTAWELVPDKDWRELTWDEQALFDPDGGLYRFDTHESTITAQGKQLTLFIRGWKKWINNGSGIFDIQEVSLVGPAPAGAETPLVQPAAVEAPAVAPMLETPAEEMNVEDAPAETVENTASEFAGSSDEVVSEDAAESVAAADETMSTEVVEAQPETQAAAPANGQMMLEPPVSTQPQASVAPLPESGQGENDSIKYIIISGIALLLILIVSAVTATARRRRQPE